MSVNVLRDTGHPELIYFAIVRSPASRGTMNLTTLASSHPRWVRRAPALSETFESNKSTCQPNTNTNPCKRGSPRREISPPPSRKAS